MGCLYSRTEVTSLRRSIRKSPSTNGHTNGITRIHKNNNNNNYRSADNDDSMDGLYDGHLFQIRSPPPCPTPTPPPPTPRPIAVAPSTSAEEGRKLDVLFAEDLQPANPFPDAMTVVTFDNKHSKASVSNVHLKTKTGNGTCPGNMSKRSSLTNHDLSIEELDTELDQYSRLASDRHIFKEGEKFNPSTTDVLLPLRKQKQLSNVHTKPSSSSSHVLKKQNSDTSKGKGKGKKKTKGKKRKEKTPDNMDQNATEVVQLQGMLETEDIQDVIYNQGQGKTHGDTSGENLDLVDATVGHSEIATCRETHADAHNDISRETVDLVDAANDDIHSDVAVRTQSSLEVLDVQSDDPKSEISTGSGYKAPLINADFSTKTVQLDGSDMETKPTEVEHADGGVKNTNNDTGNACVSTENQSKGDQSNIVNENGGVEQNEAHKNDIKSSDGVIHFKRNSLFTRSDKSKTERVNSAELVSKSTFVTVTVNGLLDADRQRLKRKRKHAPRKVQDAVRREEQHKSDTKSDKNNELEGRSEIMWRPISGNSTWTWGSRSTLSIGSSDNCSVSSLDTTAHTSTQKSRHMSGPSPVSFTSDYIDHTAELIDMENETHKTTTHTDIASDTSLVHSTNPTTNTVHTTTTFKPDQLSFKDEFNENIDDFDTFYDTKVGTSSSNVMSTKQKLLYARHERRPHSDYMLRDVGRKPPIYPKSVLKQRPTSETVRSSPRYSRYFSVDNDHFIQ